jgi:hypothetical protein
MSQIPEEPNLSDKKKEAEALREREQLLKDIYRSDMEKFKLFTQMLRLNALYKRAKITHK